MQKSDITPEKMLELEDQVITRRFTKIIDKAKKQFREKGMLPSLIMFFTYNYVKENYVHIVVPMTASNDEEKQMFGEILQNLAGSLKEDKNLKIIGVLSVLDVFMKETSLTKNQENKSFDELFSTGQILRPSEDPDSKSVIMFLLEQNNKITAKGFEYIEFEEGKILQDEPMFVRNISQDFPEFDSLSRFKQAFQ